MRDDRSAGWRWLVRRVCVVLHTALACLIGLIIGGSFYALVRVLPLRSIRRLADDLQEAHDTLERRVAERTIELDNATKAAEAATRAKSEFLANMSHEVRTPLNGVLGMAQALLASPLNRQQRSHTQTLVASGERLLVLINDILDLSKIEAGSVELERITFDPQSLVQDIIVPSAVEAEAKGLDLIVHVDRNVPPRIEGDPTRIGQVLANFLSNAIKFTDAGQIVIEMRAKPSSDSASSMLHISVADTGPGIAVEAQGSLFKAFSQADGSITRRYGGTGLGLAISKHLVALMGGAIGMTSAPGQGSKFWFSIPVPPREDAPTEPMPLMPLEGCGALVVVQRPTNRRMLCAYLDRLSVRHCVALSAADAIVRAQVAESGGARYDFVLTDLELAGSDEEVLVARLGKLAATRESHWIVLGPLTGHRPVGAPWAAERLYLETPVYPRSLERALYRALDAQGFDSDQPGPHRGRRNSLRILLAEDNPVNQIVAQAMLAPWDCTVEIANNGALALEAHLKDPFDVVLMDVQMPEMDGLQATRHIRNFEREGRLPERPIIAMTANAYERDREACLEAGMNDFIAKPLLQSRLTEVLSRWMSIDRAAITRY